MPSPFDFAMAAVNVAIDETFGEAFVLEPRVAPVIAAPILANGRPDVNARAVASVARSPIGFRGTWIAPGAEQHAVGRAMSDRTTRPMVTDHPMIDVDEAAFPSGAAAGDRIVREGTGETFELTKQVPGDIGRAWLHLARLQTSALTR